MSELTVGADTTRWDLTVFYKAVDDPQIDIDVAELAKRAGDFHAAFKGQLADKLSEAIVAYGELDMLSNKVMIYLFLQQSLDVTNAPVKAKLAEVERILSQAQGGYLTFFDIELVALDDTTLERWYAKDPLVAKHKPWIDQHRIFRPHLLSEPVESALTKRSPFGVGAWAEFFDEAEADLRFDWRGDQKTLTEMIHIVSTSLVKTERAEAMKVMNAGLGGHFAKYAAQTLYIVAGDGGVEDKERKYKHPMEGRNKSNQIPDAVVDALHATVTEVGAPLIQRYYKLKAQLLGLPHLAWSDRNAPLPFSDTTIVPFVDATKTVLAAYESFSPTLAGLVRDFIAANRIDAPATPGKRGGAFNYSAVLPGHVPASFTFLNYLGAHRDVMTLAHELGHGVHGILAGKAQGPLMFHAPIAYCETASVFGEMTTFNFLKKELEKTGDKKALLALIAGKIEDTANTIIRQIGFSNFERRLHGMDPVYQTWFEPKKMSVEELNALWLTTLKEMYGAEGDVFTYQDTEHLWTYISHFHRPFYVYGYAFGELLTQGLYAKQSELGEKFEPLYLDLLSSGSTRDVVELLKPFGLDPTNKQFWADGIKVSLEAMIIEAEALVKEIF